MQDVNHLCRYSVPATVGEAVAIEAKGAASLSLSLSLSLSRAERVARIESMSKRSQQSETSAGAAAELARAAGQADHWVYQRRQEQRYVCLLAAEQSIYAGLHSDVFTQHSLLTLRMP